MHNIELHCVSVNSLQSTGFTFDSRTCFNVWKTFFLLLVDRLNGGSFSRKDLYPLRIGTHLNSSLQWIYCMVYCVVIVSSWFLWGNIEIVEFSFCVNKSNKRNKKKTVKVKRKEKITKRKCGTCRHRSQSQRCVHRIHQNRRIWITNWIGLFTKSIVRCSALTMTRRTISFNRYPRKSQFCSKLSDVASTFQVLNAHCKYWNINDVEEDCENV